MAGKPLDCPGLYVLSPVTRTLEKKKKNETKGKEKKQQQRRRKGEASLRSSPIISHEEERERKKKKKREGSFQGKKRGKGGERRTPASQFRPSSSRPIFAA